MILKVVKYGNPVLRKKGAKIETITPAVKKLIADMFETMYDARGIGLAAQQIGEALQVTVIDVREASAERPSTLEINGKAVDPAELMPLSSSIRKSRPWANRSPDRKAASASRKSLRIFRVRKRWMWWR